jgi:hypothetical protein
MLIDTHSYNTTATTTAELDGYSIMIRLVSNKICHGHVLTWVHPHEGLSVYPELLALFAKIILRIVSQS